MPHHYWGDEDFDFDSLYKAISEADRFMRVYGRIGVHSKEKYGTARWSLYFCNNSLHSITHPGYMYSQYPKWLWTFDVMQKPLRYIGPAIRFFQRRVAEMAFSDVCYKYPHIVKEIISDAPEKFLPPHLEVIRASMWSRTCKCGNCNTTDLVYCKSCGAKL
jgi:hypothetical protein